MINYFALAIILSLLFICGVLCYTIFTMDKELQEKEYKISMLLRRVDETRS